MPSQLGSSDPAAKQRKKPEVTRQWGKNPLISDLEDHPESVISIAMSVLIIELWGRDPTVQLRIGHVKVIPQTHLVQ